MTLSNHSDRELFEAWDNEIENFATRGERIRDMGWTEALFAAWQAGARAAQSTPAAPQAAVYWCNKCGYRGPDRDHNRPTTGDPCGYIGRDLAVPLPAAPSVPLQPPQQTDKQPDSVHLTARSDEGSTRLPPEGFRLLPVEATDAMMDADWDVSMSDAHSNGGVSAAAWRAMVEAAPVVTYGSGHSGPGWYMHDAEYPEEGAVFLGPAPSKDATEGGEQNENGSDFFGAAVGAEFGATPTPPAAVRVTCTDCRGTGEDGYETSGVPCSVCSGTGTTPPAAVSADARTLRQHIDALIAEHGTMRAVARALCIDVGYLHRLRSGEKHDPSDDTLQKLGLVRLDLYAAMAGKPAGEQP